MGKSKAMILFVSCICLGYKTVAQKMDLTDPVLHKVVEDYFDEYLDISIKKQSKVTVLQIEEISFFKLDDDSSLNGSKIKEVKLVIYQHNDQALYNDVPPSISFFINKNLVLLYFGHELLIHRNLKEVVSQKAWNLIKMLPNRGVFNTKDFTRVSYIGGKFRSEKVNRSSVDPVILGNLWLTN